MPFDYENAERDILDAGGDPDYLSYTNPTERDNYLRKMGLRPEEYGGGMRTPEMHTATDQQYEFSGSSSADAGSADDLMAWVMLAVGLIALLPIVLLACIAVHLLLVPVFMLVYLWEAFKNLSVFYQCLILFIPLFTVLIILGYRHDRYRKKVQKVLSVLGTPFRPVFRRFQEDSTAALAFLVVILLGLLLVGTCFFLYFR